MRAAERVEREIETEGDAESSTEDDDSSVHAEHVTVNVMPNSIEFTSDVEDYALCPSSENQFADLCLWEFIERTVKEWSEVPVDPAPEIEDLDSDEPHSIKPKRCRRQKLLRARFSDQHSQYESHILRMRRKPVIPVLLGDAIPQRDGSEEEYEKYCQCMMLLFKLWRNIRTLKGNHSTWAKVFETKTFSLAIAVIIRNMNIEKECKEAQDTHAALVREQCAKPHVLGQNAMRPDEGQLDMLTFDEALFADASLDPVKEEYEGIDGQSDIQGGIDADKNSGDIETCLRAGKDGGLFRLTDSSVTDKSACKEMNTELLTDGNRGRVQEFADIMKAAKKRKRLIDVGSADAEVKRMRLQQVEDEPSISFE